MWEVVYIERVAELKLSKLNGLDGSPSNCSISPGKQRVTPLVFQAVGPSRGLRGGADESWQRREEMGMREAILQIVPEGEPQLLTGLLQAEEGVPGRPARFAAGGRTDLAFLDVVTNVILAEVIVQRNLRAL